MSTPTLLSELKLLAAHQEQALQITKRNIKKMEGEQQRKTKGLDEKVKADIRAKRLKTALK